tara:strand:+ start:40 stop:1035 length:996 start_codon:yes stop_codon:yes gene_type:complete
MEALAMQTHRPLEIVAVDDGSTDGSRDRLQKWHDPEGKNVASNGIPIRVLAMEPSGLSAGRNLALEKANGEWVAITDIDCRPEPDWISNMAATTEGVQAVTGRVVFDKGCTPTSALRSSIIAEKYAGRGEFVTLANGPCSMFRKDKLLEVGGFDPSWYHAEDMEVSMKIIASDGKIRYVPGAVVNHVPESSISLFYHKRKRDSRAHTRIVRRYRGVKHDFTGNSALLLTLLPTHLFELVAILMFLSNLGWQTASDPSSYMDALSWQILLLLLPGVVVTTLLVFRLKLIDLTSSKRIRTSIQLIFIVNCWSTALWHGLLMGGLDALLGRNGH